MAKTDYKSVDEYIAAQPEAVQGILGDVRATLRKALPKAQEVISYQIPAYKIDGAGVIYFSSWKKHYALYPASKTVASTFRKELAPYDLEKYTLRFPLTKPVPRTLIAAIAKLRAKEVAAEVEKKAAAKKKKR